MKKIWLYIYIKIAMYHIIYKYGDKLPKKQL